MYVPPLMRPLVLIADIDKDVIVVTTVVVRINKIAWPEITLDVKISRNQLIESMIERMMGYLPTPVCATTQESRRKSITPQMLRRHRISTPWIHPNFTPDAEDFNCGTFNVCEPGP